MTTLKRRRHLSTDVPQLTLGPALRELGNALDAIAAPRRDFQRDLRQRLIDEARLLAAQPKARPRSGRPRRPKGGGIRLAAIGIGLSVAGGGVVAASHSLTLPARAATQLPAIRPAPPAGDPPSAAHAAAPGSRSAVGGQQPEGASREVTASVSAPPTDTPRHPATGTPGDAVLSSSPLSSSPVTPSAAGSAGAFRSEIAGTVDLPGPGTPPAPSDPLPSLLGPWAVTAASPPVGPSVTALPWDSRLP